MRAAGCWTCILAKMVAPSFVMVTSPARRLERILKRGKGEKVGTAFEKFFYIFQYSNNKNRYYMRGWKKQAGMRTVCSYDHFIHSSWSWMHHDDPNRFV